jgi:aminocarboxymuconate-semialdehyde decarboxylase
MLRIDMHSHIIPEKLPNFAEKFGYGDFIYLRHHKQGFAQMMRGNQFFREIGENCWNPGLRIEEYESHDTQVQVICTIPVMFSYWANAIDCLELSRFLNDHIAQVVSDYPRHYLGLGTIPMQDAELAIRELERIKSVGLQGVQIGSNINNENLGDGRFFPIFEACQELDLAILVHPWEMMGMKHMRKYWLPWLVGMPAETTRAICSIIFSGLMERLPHLRFNFAHSGGSFLSTLGRIAHGFECRPDLVAIDNPVNPKEYLGRFWVDSITHDPKMLRYVIDMVGIERVTLGSDYPFPLGDLTIGSLIEELELSDKDKKMIFARSALAWLGISSERFELND